MVRRFIGSLGEGRGRRRCRIAVGMKIVNEDQNRGVTIGSTRTRARVTLDHALVGQEGFDLLSQFGDTVVLLWYATRVSIVLRKGRQ